jgi:hypothetical protein
VPVLRPGARSAPARTGSACRAGRRESALAGAYSDKLRQEAKERREAAGEVFAGSVSERDVLQLIDTARVDAVARGRETAHSRALQKFAPAAAIELEQEGRRSREESALGTIT